MSNINDLYGQHSGQKQPCENGPQESAPGGPTLLPSGAPPELAGLTAGGPSRVIKDDPVEALAMTAEEMAAFKQGLLMIMQGISPLATLYNADRIPYAPGVEPTAVQTRIAQGPYVFEGKQAMEKAQTQSPQLSRPGRPPGKIAAGDMSKPGRFIKGDSPPYRPGA